ncbi:MAG: DUF3419 family protein [Patescibacteria group bacterium]|nr:DUF3419 family protein [Patescibacteria group bacterium]MDE2438631.1 DUF3419 family protein [Patescibacteria group bacterium]
MNNDPTDVSGAETRTYDGAESNTMTSKSRMYVYATEMVAEYYARLDLKDKSILTVVGSGDQIINAYFFGAKEVIGFDINTRAPLFADLKINALRELSYEEFLSFFGHTFSDGMFDEALYIRFRDALRVETQEFFDACYATMKGSEFLSSEFFRQRSVLTISPTTVNAYLRDEAAYGTTKRALLVHEPRCVACEIQDLPACFRGKTFDMINISNIPNYFVRKSEERVKEFLSVLRALHTLLAPRGFIFFYTYSPLSYDEGTLPLASRDITLQRIRDMDRFDMSEYSFSSLIVSGDKDKIIVLKKRV